MALDQRLQSDLKDAMRSGDRRRRDVLRYLQAAIKNAEIEQRTQLNDDEVVAVISRQIKQRRDSIEAFERGGRQDLADEESAQIAVLEAYLPQQMSDEEVAKLVQEVADNIGAQEPRDMARLMPAALEASAGRADGSRISHFAREELQRRAQTPR